MIRKILPVFLCLGTITLPALSQEAALPDAPSAVAIANEPVDSPGGQSGQSGPQTFARAEATVNPGDNQPETLTAQQKFGLMTRRAVSIPGLLVPAFVAGIEQAEDKYPEWGQGAEGFGKRYAAELADTQARNFLHTFVFSSLFKQDPRYFRMAEGTTGERLKYAATRALVTRGDNGNQQPNISLILASLASATLQNAYLPRREQTGGDTAIRFGRNMGIQMGVNVAREFLPGLRRIIR